MNIERAARLAGLLHDLGKYCGPFQSRLEGSSLSVDHSTAGALEVIAMAKDSPIADRRMAELVAYAIAGHHAGLPDGLSERLENRNLPPLEPLWRQEISPDATMLLPAFRPAGSKEQVAFQFAFLARMLFSCLVDADFKDTEAYYAHLDGKSPDRDWPALPDIIGGLVRLLEASLTAMQTDAPASPVNRLRADILSHVTGRAEDQPGIFTLTVPTGGGKTLTSLAFALRHARAHGLQRIIYAIPFTSIIDQTATVFRNILGDEVLLEHHSSLDDEAVSAGQRDKLKLAMEDWAAPVVVTTNVQLFESLFGNRPGKCRKLHNLARSVIILDEAQTLPRGLLKPSVAALEELARNHGATIVLCTATQPALGRATFGAKDGIGFDLDGRELAPDPAGLARTLKRVTLVRGGELDDAALVEALRETKQGLVIVNGRRHALLLYQAAEAAGLDGLLHLTTRQHAADRRRILSDIRQRLKEDEPCRVIATSLVEAGVDLDFPSVWRAEAGLDQIAQAAGRCNREGKRPVEKSLVTIFKPTDHKPPREIAGLIGDLDRMADKYDELLSPAAMTAYFEEVFWRHGERLDSKKILNDFMMDGSGTAFNYRTAADKFRMIESGLAPVIVATDEAPQKTLTDLEKGFITPRAAARQLQPWIVPVPPKARAAMIKAARAMELAEFDAQFVQLTDMRLYDRSIGLRWEDAETLSTEDTII